MKFLFRKRIDIWWRVTGFVGKNANWFLGFSERMDKLK